MAHRNLILASLCFVSLLTIVSCSNRKIVYSGFNDLVVGSQSFILYNDKSFFIEMGAGGVEGHYKINHDTVELKYFSKPGPNWPDVMLIRKDYFISLDSLDSKKHLKIRRDK